MGLEDIAYSKLERLCGVRENNCQLQRTRGLCPGRDILVTVRALWIGNALLSIGGDCALGLCLFGGVFSFLRSLGRRAIPWLRDYAYLISTNGVMAASSPGIAYRHWLPSCSHLGCRLSRTEPVALQGATEPVYISEMLFVLPQLDGSTAKGVVERRLEVAIYDSPCRTATAKCEGQNKYKREE